jgi:hypothetical protein
VLPPRSSQLAERTRVEPSRSHGKRAELECCCEVRPEGTYRGPRTASGMSAGQLVWLIPPGPGVSGKGSPHSQTTLSRTLSRRGPPPLQSFSVRSSIGHLAVSTCGRLPHRLRQSAAGNGRSPAPQSPRVSLSLATKPLHGGVVTGEGPQRNTSVAGHGFREAPRGFVPHSLHDGDLENV